MRTGDVKRFLRAVRFLSADEELRVRYFDDPSLEMEIEFYDAQTTWEKGVFASVDYNAYKADGALNPNSGGFVIPVCDYGCPKIDAARHVPGMKKGVIVLPRDADGLAAWCYINTKWTSRGDWVRRCRWPRDPNDPNPDYVFSEDRYRQAQR